MTFRLNDQPLTDVQRTAMRTDLGVRDLSTGEIGTLDRGEARESHLLTKVAFVDTSVHGSVQLFQIAMQQQGVTGAVAAIINPLDPIIYEAGTQTVLAGGDSGVTIHVGTEVRADDNGSPSFYRWSGGTWAEISQPAVTGSSASSSYSLGYQIPYDQLEQQTQAAFVMVMGQSNTERGANINTDTAFPNVFTLRRGNVWNNLTDETQWSWSGFSSSFDYNLGRGTSGHVNSNAYALARAWQNRINNGETLPDLYLVQISHSSGGFSAADTDLRAGHGFFSPTFDENPRDRSGQYDDVPPERFWLFCPRVHRWALNELRSRDLFVRHLGIFWNQFEHDVAEASPEYYREYLEEWLELFDRDAQVTLPFAHMLPRAPWFAEQAGRDAVQAALLEDFETIRSMRPSLAIDVQQHPQWNATATRYGIYSDGFHYINTVTRWIGQQLDNWYTTENYGQYIDPAEDVAATTTASASAISDITGLQAALDAKADDTDITTLQTSLDGKADTADVPTFNDLPVVTEWRANTFSLGQVTLPSVKVAGNTTFAEQNDALQLRVEREDGRRYFNNTNYVNGANLLFLFPSITEDSLYFSFDVDFASGSRVGLGIAYSATTLAGNTFASTGHELYASLINVDTGDGNFSNIQRMSTYRLDAAATQLSQINFTGQMPYTNRALTEEGRLSFRSELINSVHTVRLLWIPNGGAEVELLNSPMNAVLNGNTFSAGGIGILFGIGTRAEQNILQNLRITRIGAQSLE